MVEELDGPQEAAQLEAMERARGHFAGPQMGETWFLVSTRWFDVWRRYAAASGARPPAIDNQDLAADSIHGESSDSGVMGEELRADLLEKQDYEMVCEEVWNKLVAWYGGGPQFPRKVVSKGKHAFVEVNHLQFSVMQHVSDNDVLHPSKSHQRVNGLSCANSLGDLKRKIRSALVELPENIDVFAVQDGHTDSTPLSPDSSTLDELGLFQRQTLLVKKSKTSGANGHSTGTPMSRPRDSSEDPSGAATFRFTAPPPAPPPPPPPPPLAEHGPSPSTSSMILARTNETPTGPIPVEKLGGKAGITGLNNLGNTCFLNSAVQCLSNTKELTEFFLSEEFVADLNEDNPIGTNGILAKEYNRVLRNLWAGNQSSFAPRNFKLDIATFAPQFSGYAQQDSQELLAFLLDGIHEDLNRIKKKPYVEAVEERGRPEGVVAEEAWVAHKRRHDSKVVDLFQGQYKSTVVCPDCKKVSVTFDPFMYLTLPLPAKRHINVTFFLFRSSAASERPTKYTVSLLKAATISDLRDEVGKLTGIPANKLIVAESMINRVYALDDKKAVDTISSLTDTLIYEVDDEVKGDGSFGTSSDEHLVVEINQRIPRNPSSSAVPFLVTLKRDKLTGVGLGLLIKERAKRYVDFEAGEKNALSDNDSEEAAKEMCTVTMKAQFTTSEIRMNLNSAEPLEVPHSCKHVAVHVEWQDRDWFDAEEASMKESFVEHESVAAQLSQPMETSVSLARCLDLWGEEETLSEENAWYCPDCKAHKQASKRLRLWRSPEILVVHLKRFSYTTYLRNKLETFVDFPLTNFELNSFVDGPSSANEAPYDLFAVSNHFGGLGGGHYTAHAKSPWKEGEEGSGWYNFDDSIVSPIINPASIQSSSAYLLFYRRRQHVSPSAATN